MIIQFKMEFLGGKDFKNIYQNGNSGDMIKNIIIFPHT